MGGTGGSATGAFANKRRHRPATGGNGGGSVTVIPATNKRHQLRRDCWPQRHRCHQLPWARPAGNGGSSGAAYAAPGGGGGGGSSGTVTVTANGSITTSGFGAFGIQAESTGGGGGTAANGGGVVSVGGTGGAASDGGVVNVNNYGSITTTGLFSHGIAAASIGGGGGAGSHSGGLVALGGAGNSSGDGNTVTVTNYFGANIQTSGIGAYGIYAESLGGGCGNGWRRAGKKKARLDRRCRKHRRQQRPSICLQNYGTIGTTRASAAAIIFAQSVSGGGGDGGFRQVLLRPSSSASGSVAAASKRRAQANRFLSSRIPARSTCRGFPRVRIFAPKTGAAVAARRRRHGRLRLLRDNMP